MYIPSSEAFIVAELSLDRTAQFSDVRSFDAAKVFAEKPKRGKMAVEDVKSVCSFSGVEELHVLAVDDSLVDRKVIERLLKNSCCKVTAVDSGSRALQYLGLDGERIPVGFDELKVNLIITDYSMPGMTGYELLKKIKGSTQLSQIPVVIMSSENILTRIDRCLEEGAEDFLVKPVKLSDVERLREFVLRGEDRIERAVGRKRKTSDDDSYVSSPSPSASSLDSSPASSPESVSAETHHQLLAKRPRLPSSDLTTEHEILLQP